MAERSFKEEVGKLKLGDGRGIPRRRHPRRDQGAVAVRRILCGRLPGRADLAPDGRAGRRQRNPRRARRAFRELGERGDGRRHPRGFRELSAARRGHVQIHRRHQRRVRRAGQPRLGRRHRRRAGDHRRGLRRRLLDHAGARARLCDEVADVAARSAPQPAVDRARRGKQLRAFRSLQHPGHDDDAHPRVPRVRPLHHQGEQAPRIRPDRRAGESAPRSVTHRDAADDLRPREGQVGGAPAGRAEISSRSTGSTNSSTAMRTTSASSCRAVSTTRRCAR